MDISIQMASYVMKHSKMIIVKDNNKKKDKHVFFLG
jgi:hypothetical protein